MTMSEYIKAKAKFAKKHGGFRETSDLMGEMVQKQQVFDDGAVWYEVTMPVIETAKFTVRGLPMTTKVKLHRTEFWNTDDHTSKYLYEA
jgi:hypothetical protein